MTELLGKILDKIESYDRIIIFRHIRVDGDCVGASKGLKALLKATYPEKEVFIIDDEHSNYLAFVGPDDPPVPDETYETALGIVVDTASRKRIANQKYALCKELVKIDHHINLEPYGDLEWVEEERSSACEMIVAFYTALRDRLVMTREAATYLYLGMVTDSGRFRNPEVSGETLRCAGLLLDQGIDTQMLFAHLYLGDYEALKFKAYVYEHMQRTENGVAYFYISEEIRKQFNLTFEDASASISYLDSIKGCLCWLAFIESGDQEHSIRVRLRSRFVAINQVAEHFRGGGHAFASGATVFNQAEVDALVREADETVRDYKATHSEWL